MLTTKGLALVEDDVRLGGIHVAASKGTGKSRLVGRGIAFADFYRQIPLVILDPHGPTIDNFLDKITYLPKKEQAAAWSRIRYVDMAGTDQRVASWPLLYRAGKESLDEVAMRYLDVIRRLDPELQRAPILGENPLRDIGTSIGIILAALDLQIPGHADDILLNPQQWFERFDQAVARYPEARGAAASLRAFATQPPGERNRLTSSYRAKIQLFRHDPVMQAMYGTNTPAIDWDAAMRQRQAVLLDFRHVRSKDRKRFGLTWVYRHFIDFLERRGAGRLTAERWPISLIIDEITYLLNGPRMYDDLLATDLVELLDVLARNYLLWPTLVHQEMRQVSPLVGEALMSMSTQVLGSTTSRETAMMYTQRFSEYRPHRVKKEIPHYALERFDLGLSGAAETRFGPRDHYSTKVLLDTTTENYSIAEQWELNLPRFYRMPRYAFALGIAASEGAVPTMLQRATIERLDTGQFVNEALVAEARRRLWLRDGTPVPPPQVPLIEAAVPPPPRQLARERQAGRSSV